MLLNYRLKLCKLCLSQEFKLGRLRADFLFSVVFGLSHVELSDFLEHSGVVYRRHNYKLYMSLAKLVQGAVCTVTELPICNSCHCSSLHHGDNVDDCCRNLQLIGKKVDYCRIRSTLLPGSKGGGCAVTICRQPTGLC